MSRERNSFQGGSRVVGKYGDLPTQPSPPESVKYPPAQRRASRRARTSPRCPARCARPRSHPRCAGRCPGRNGSGRVRNASVSSNSIVWDASGTRPQPFLPVCTANTAGGPEKATGGTRGIRGKLEYFLC
eukprot:gene10376-biopygen18288